MPLPGPAFYDDDAAFTTYMRRREDPDNPNNTLEKPVPLELLGDLAGLRILDLGCGDAAFGREALVAGAGSYIGIDGAANMVAVARRTLMEGGGMVEQATIERWAYPPAAFDLVISRLALHYVEDFAAVCAQVWRTLASGGRFVFSVEHPVITSCARGWQSGERQAWIVDDYFVVGRRVTTWMGAEVVKFHRTVEGYFAALQAAGFAVESLRESHPQRDHFTDEALYARRQRIPLFLFLAARKMG
jgi:SAM-dependent methyltransferase